MVCSTLCGLTVAFLISLAILAAKKADEAEKQPAPPITPPTDTPGAES